jgi:hypothetical protein
VAFLTGAEAAGDESGAELAFRDTYFEDAKVRFRRVEAISPLPLVHNDRI